MKYKETHPWLRFSLDMEAARPEIWMLLGEACSKCQHIAGVPLKPEFAEDLHILYLAKGALATTAIEGNTLTEDEALAHIEGKLSLPPSREYLTKELDNIIDACNEITAAIIDGGHTGTTLAETRRFNASVLDGLSLEEDVIPGKFRQHSVTVGRYRGAPAEDLEFLCEKLFAWLDSDAFPPQQGREMAIGILKAIILHIYFVWIHPFGDGNGRTARLLEFKTLFAAGVPTPASHLLSNHYNQTRTQYYRELDNASRSGGNIIPFIQYALQGFVDGLKEQLNEIRIHQWNISWENHVHEQFKTKNSPADIRRRHLILGLSASTDWGNFPISRIRIVSERIALEYQRVTAKTITRDINELIKMGLLKKEGKFLKVRKSTILAFLPLRIGNTRDLF